MITNSSEKVEQKATVSHAGNNPENKSVDACASGDILEDDACLRGKEDIENGRHEVPGQWE